MTAQEMDDIEAFINARIREEPETREVALSSLHRETIRPFLHGDEIVHRNARVALRILAWQWRTHPDYDESWSPGPVQFSPDGRAEQ
ncbi:fatty acid desaturase [Lipingzhangella halophila]|uniref:Fatty acid desaturase n=1 Tax=Lipingzhangella halophila TaxID=1783352 RepID=A0A7W7RH35_9ACTN|nr:hypothetical protein [Lipingzhangella halophila]MBB4931881.1 fatty acid desaturase [Lipingzhangella halophila]